MRKIFEISLFKSALTIGLKVLILGVGIFLLTSVGMATMYTLQGNNDLDFYGLLELMLTGGWENFALLVVFAAFLAGLINLVVGLIIRVSGPDEKT